MMCALHVCMCVCIYVHVCMHTQARTHDTYTYMYVRKRKQDEWKVNSKSTLEKHFGTILSVLYVITRGEDIKARE